VEDKVPREVSHPSMVPWPHLPMLAIFLFMSIVPFLVHNEVAAQHRQAVASTLETILATTHEALRIWGQDRKRDVSIWADQSDVREAVRRQLAVPRVVTPLRQSAVLFAASLDAVSRRLGFVGADVIAPDGVHIASTRPEAVGTSELVRFDHQTISSALAGAVALGLPFRPTDLDPQSMDRSPSMIVAAPVLDDEQKVIAALVFRIDPSLEFSKIMRLGRVSDTGETYAFDSRARLLTHSRFDEQLRATGLVSPGEEAILAIEIRDPGGDLVKGYRPRIGRADQPLTRMAQSAVNGHSGVDVDGYRDYRGAPVVGAWLWDPDLGLGLTSEIDKADAFAMLHATQRLMLFMVFAMVGGALAVSCMLLERARHLSMIVASERAARAALERSIAKLKETEAELGVAVRARDEFLSMASHELRTPLTSLNLLYQHLVRRAPGGCPVPLRSEDIERFVKTSERQFQRLGQMIDNLLDVSKLSVGQVLLNLEEIDLAPLVRDVVERLAEQTAAAGSKVTLDLDEPVVGHWDRFRVEQVITNLITNAARYGLGHPIRVVLRRGSSATLAVEDQGIGIAKENRSKVFERFVRLDGNLQSSGLGLGLYICRAIVEAHGGTIRVDSEVGKGSTFTVELPLPPLQDEIAIAR
jgi:signal transduction histidine kinase